jgi:hypothetical protein
MFTSFSLYSMAHLCGADVRDSCPPHHPHPESIAATEIRADWKVNGSGKRAILRGITSHWCHTCPGESRNRWGSSSSDVDNRSAFARRWHGWDGVPKDVVRYCVLEGEKLVRWRDVNSFRVPLPTLFSDFLPKLPKQNLFFRMDIVVTSRSDCDVIVTSIL